MHKARGRKIMNLAGEYVRDGYLKTGCIQDSSGKLFKSVSLTELGKSLLESYQQAESESVMAIIGEFPWAPLLLSQQKRRMYASSNRQPLSDGTLSFLSIDPTAGIARSLSLTEPVLAMEATLDRQLLEHVASSDPEGAVLNVSGYEKKERELPRSLLVLAYTFYSLKLTLSLHLSRLLASYRGSRKDFTAAFKSEDS